VFPDGPIPQQLLALAAAATVFTVMFEIGLGVVLGQFHWIPGYPGALARAMFAVLIATPTLSLLVTELFDLPRAAQIGIVLMAISPGAPIALRRSLGAGGDRSFVPALQILIALVAVVSMPLSISALDVYFAGHASIGVADVARQVFVAQLLPLGLGLATRNLLPRPGEWLQRKLAPLSTAMLILLVVLLLADVWHVVVGSGLRVAAAIIVVTLLALAAGHAMGGAEPGTRTAVAICSAARNPGLALLVATFNDAPPAVVATVLTYLIVSALTAIAYVAWRRRASRHAVASGV